jgi:hypothetical protein
MISSITGIGGVKTVGGWHSKPYFTNNDMNNNKTPVEGDVRFNGTTGKLECWVNNYWQPVSSGDVTVELTPDVQQVLNWAKDKMSQEQHIKELAEQHPSIASAVNQLDTLVSLLQDQSKKE